MKHHLQIQNSTDDLMRHYGQNVSTTLDGCGAFAVSDICLQIMAPQILVDVCLLLIIRLINVHVEAINLDNSHNELIKISPQTHISSLRCDLSESSV